MLYNKEMDEREAGRMKTREILIAACSPAPAYEYTSPHIAKLRLALLRFWLAHWQPPGGKLFRPRGILWGFGVQTSFLFCSRQPFQSSFVSSDTPGTAVMHLVRLAYIEDLGDDLLECFENKITRLVPVMPLTSRVGGREAVYVGERGTRD